MSNSPASTELAGTLRQLRTDAGLSGVEAARRAGLTQSKVSRLETGRHAPTVKEVNALCRAYRVDADTRAALVSIAKDMEAGTSQARIVLQNPARLQQRIGRVEYSSSILRSFQPNMIIGLTQTPDYAVEITEPDLQGDKREEAARARLERQSVLDTERQFTFVHTEGALRWHIGSPSLMAEQMDHLAAIMDRSNVRAGVIPWDRPVSTYARHGFHLYDSKAAIITTELGMAFMTDPVQVRHYERRFAEFEAVAVFDDEARIVLERIANDYRRLAT